MWDPCTLEWPAPLLTLTFPVMVSRPTRSPSHLPVPTLTCCFTPPRYLHQAGINRYLGYGIEVPRHFAPP